MRLTENEIEEFGKIYFKKFGKEISRDDAENEARKLILFVKAVMSGPPISKDQEEALFVESLKKLLRGLRVEMNADNPRGKDIVT